MQRRLGPILGAPLMLVLAACGGTAATNTPAPAATTAATAAATATRTTGAAATPATSAVASPASPTRAASTPATPGTPGTPRPSGTPATPGRATPGTPGTPGTPRAGGTTVGTDETNTCQIGVPSGFTAVGGQPGAWTDRSALIIVTVVPMAGMDFATFTQTIPALIATTPGTTVGATQTSPDRYRADFTATADPTNLLIPYAAAGTFVAVPATGGNACAAELIFPQGQEATYTPLVEPFVASVRPRQP